MEILRRALARGEPYDLAILDMQMPGMDGIQLARAIEADPGLANTRLILLTSMGNQYSPVLKEAGFRAGLAKPIRQSQLFDCIANVMADILESFERPSNGKCAGTSLGSNKVITNTKADPRKELRILVAEDNAVNQKVALRMLEKMGYSADVANNGSEAVASASRIPYDIVFMDSQMPEMNGFEATARIRSVDGVERHTIIVAMTANALQGDREKCLAAGMDDYISKPIRKDDLADAIDRWSLAKEARKAPFQEANKTDPLLDESVLQRLGELVDDDDPYLLEQLLSMFVNETPKRLELIRRSLRVRDPHGLCEMAHLIKGTCMQLGLPAMASICQNLQDRAESLALGDCNQIFAQLEQTFHETKQLLESKYRPEMLKHENRNCRR
jgi:CheY-like chemotaxis protein